MKPKKWEIKSKVKWQMANGKSEEIIKLLLENRGIKTDIDRKNFLSPPDPYQFTPQDVGIDERQVKKAMERIEKAIKDKESVVVYADYDADGVTAGAVMWETLHALGAKVMPYVPHRVDEGYGLSTIGIDAVKKDYDATLIITVDHGITAKEKVAYAKKKGIDVVVTDHHTKPSELPDTTIVHTTALSGSGVSWYVAKTLMGRAQQIKTDELLALVSIGTIADLLPLQGPNRAIVSYGLKALNDTKRVGLKAMIQESGLPSGKLGVYDVSHVLAPRLNALGRLEHALDALRLLCTTNEERALSLAARLGSVNRDRQQLTQDTSLHAKDKVSQKNLHKDNRILIIAEEMYNPGVIGLVAGKLVEEYYLPAIVLSKGPVVSKASARSIAGFNIVEAIRSCADLLVDVGGHPMAAGFTIETKNIGQFQKRMETYALEHMSEELLTRVLPVDMELPLDGISAGLYTSIQQLSPFGMGNQEPVFASFNVPVLDTRLVGNEGKHLKLRLKTISGQIEAIAFGMGEYWSKLRVQNSVNLAYSLSQNTWNGNTKIELKVKDIDIYA